MMRTRPLSNPQNPIDHAVGFWLYLLRDGFGGVGAHPTERKNRLVDFVRVGNGDMDEICVMMGFLIELLSW
jgi:hypothetical protein